MCLKHKIICYDKKEILCVMSPNANIRKNARIRIIKTKKNTQRTTTTYEFYIWAVVI